MAYCRDGKENGSTAIVKTGEGKILLDGIRPVFAQNDGLEQLTNRYEAATVANGPMR